MITETIDHSFFLKLNKFPNIPSRVKTPVFTLQVIIFGNSWSSSTISLLLLACFLKSWPIPLISNSSIAGWKLHLNPGQVLGSSQSLCSFRIFGHSRPPFDGCWMMRRFRTCFNFTTFPAERRQIKREDENNPPQKVMQIYICDDLGCSVTSFYRADLANATGNPPTYRWI